MSDTPPVSAPETEASQPDPPGSPLAGPDTEFAALDARVIDLWRVHHLIGSAILLGLALIPGVVLAVKLRGYLLGIAAAWLALALLRGWLWFWYPPRSYRAWGYRLDAKVLEIKSGIWFRVIRLLPLTRLQHVDLQRGPFERYFGLASLILHTAGTHESTLVIPGLDAEQAVRLRDQLVAAGGDDAV